MQRVLVVTGPTGAGKSDLVLSLANELPVEIISMDSAQVYRGMDIGTAKPSRAIRATVPHHLLDIREANEAYSTGEFVADVARLLPEVFARGRLPIIVGGTMLYLRSLTRGLSELPRATPEVRAAIDAEAAHVGWSAMHAKLATIDAASAERVHPNDPQRIQRALEVYMTTGRPLSEWHAQGTHKLPYLFDRMAFVPERTVLHERIELRFNDMLSAGLVEEVRALRNRGTLRPDDPAMRCVGYRQLWAHLDGAYDLQTAILKSVAATRQMAKRQLTWLRSDPELTWHDPLSDTGFAALRSRTSELGDLR
jgi:tRNA dimethylallyltransferase